ncbi:Phosphopantetheine attachment site-containing protein [Cladochytrium replicatum]|nr:Phosphopantetheine attachment site-containing protein [Cladochytrium replicatum]
MIPTVTALALLAAWSAPTTVVAQSGFAIPANAVANTQGPLKQAIVGVSFEFFTFPEYFNGAVMPLTSQCLANLAVVAGKYPPIRIGGTTQDRATYNATLASAVSYSVASPNDAPASLTYGPSFMDIAGTYAGDVTLGLNRRLNQLDNTIAAAKYGVDHIPKLTAIELGNEPEFYGSSSPIAGGKTWDPAADSVSQTSWQKSVGEAVNRTSIIQGGVRLQPQFGWSIAQLVPVETSSGSDKYVTSFGEHSYPQSACGGAATNLGDLMSHKSIVSYCTQYAAESKAARSIGKSYFISETNSATCGGGGISPTFGAALWIVDYNMQLILNGAQEVYFHAGTIGNCPYCWWGRNKVFAPYYGAYFSARVLAGASSIQALDDGKSAYASYALYDASGAPFKALLYNSDVYTSGTRASRTFTLSGITASSVSALRLTGSAANSLVENGFIPSIGGLSFSNTDCSPVGVEKLESFAVTSGTVTIAVNASEMVLVFLK